MCFSDVVKNLNIKVYNLMSRTNERRHREWYETRKCKCILDASVFNNKQRWYRDKYRCQCKKIIVCDKGSLGILVTANVNVINHVTLVNI